MLDESVIYFMGTMAYPWLTPQRYLGWLTLFFQVSAPHASITFGERSLPFHSLHFVHEAATDSRRQQLDACSRDEKAAYALNRVFPSEATGDAHRSTELCVLRGEVELLLGP